MNTVTRIIDCYFRHVKGCFTMPDVRIPMRDFCRSADLMAYNVNTKEQFHVENAVTHSQLWSFSADNLYELFDKSFLGLSGTRKGKDATPVKEGKCFKNIQRAYRSLGFSSAKVKRIFVVWCIKPGVSVKMVSNAYYKKHGIRVEVLSFRDQILSDLERKVLGHIFHYDDVLRMLSLIALRGIQTRDARS